ncbi:MAG: hypothetical protein GY696_25895, partial [Gammaproteobacteria bacterium]|nr:hypothetical protein [Gammaproteobacteria bacterium]
REIKVEETLLVKKSQEGYRSWEELPKKKLKIRVVCSGRSVPHSGNIELRKLGRKLVVGGVAPQKRI